MIAAFYDANSEESELGMEKGQQSRTTPDGWLKQTCVGRRGSFKRILFFSIICPEVVK
jgi:hypothetical protein